MPKISVSIVAYNTNKKLINKRVRVHFIFESRVIQNKNDYSKIENIFKLQKFTN